MTEVEAKRRFRVLFIDDEPRITRALKALFRDFEAYEVNDPRLGAFAAKTYDVDVVVCDQKMPEMSGTECLREVKHEQPRALRILLTGYADFQAVIGSVNDGEVYRFLSKPWDNAELRRTIEEAARIASDTPSLSPEPMTEVEAESARHELGLLVIEDNPEVQQRLREILAPHYQVHFAASVERATQILEQHEVGVVVSETHVGQGDITTYLKTLKQYHPHIAVVVITDRADVPAVAELINGGQVYRMLMKPVRMGSCRLAVDSALAHYAKLKKQPGAVRRFVVPTAEVPVVAAAPAPAPAPAAAPAAAPSSNSESLLARLRALPSRIAKFGQ